MTRCKELPKKWRCEQCGKAVAMHYCGLCARCFALSLREGVIQGIISEGVMQAELKEMQEFHPDEV